MKKILYVVCAALAFSACQHGERFQVEGTVSDAAGKTLYLEASALEGILPLDSVKLKASGSFTFKQPRPASPEFYRLRLDEKVINFSVDSTETVTVEATADDFATGYTVGGSTDSEKIKELVLKQMRLQSDVNALAAQVQARRLGYDRYQDTLAALVDGYKHDVMMNYIYAAPNTSAAYFALFQKLNDYLIFDPLNNKDDIKCFAAVATSLNNAYPHADRSKNLYNIVIKGMKNAREVQQPLLDIPADAVTETGIIDISLSDMRGVTHKLTDLKGKAVLLDFTLYQSDFSATHNYLLRDIYDKYAPQGLEIYQVSLDPDEHYWKTVADNLPWICVRDAAGIYSSTVTLYNVESVPAIFLIDKNNELHQRVDANTDIEGAIKALL